MKRRKIKLNGLRHDIRRNSFLKWKIMAYFYFSNLFRCFEILPKIRSILQWEREEKSLDNMSGNYYSSNFQLAYNKILYKYIEIIHVYFFPLQSLVNTFISSFYFYVNIGNMHTRIIPFNNHFSIVKKIWKAKVDFNHASKLIKIYFNGKGFSCDQRKLNRFKK